MSIKATIEGHLFYKNGIELRAIPISQDGTLYKKENFRVHLSSLSENTVEKLKNEGLI